MFFALTLGHSGFNIVGFNIIFIRVILTSVNIPGGDIVVCRNPQGSVNRSLSVDYSLLFRDI